MKRLYRVPFVAGTVTNAGGNNDLWIVLPADDKPCHLVGLRIGQVSEVGDTAEEGIDITIIHMAATVTDGNGSAVTPVPNNPATDTAAGFTAEINGATVATTSGTATVMDAIPWNNRNTPLEVWWPDETFYPTAIQGQALIVRMNTTIADDMTFSGCLYVVED